MDNLEQSNTQDLLHLTTDIVAAYVSNNSVSTDDLPKIIVSTYKTLKDQHEDAENKPEPDPVPAAPIRRSIQPDYIICLEDGKKLKMLKRYLRTQYNLTPEEYRAKWGLPSDYPMVAPNYSKQRSNFAKTIGLGRRRKN